MVTLQMAIGRGTRHRSFTFHVSSFDISRGGQAMSRVSGMGLNGIGGEISIGSVFGDRQDRCPVRLGLDGLLWLRMTEWFFGFSGMMDDG